MANPFLQLMFNAANSLAKPAPQQQPQFEMYQPTYQNQNRFASLIDNMPQPTNPSIWRKIGGTLSGLGQQDPYGTAVGITNAPYFNELANWRMKAPFMQQSADNERQMNQVGMQGNNQIRQFQINERKNELADKKIESSERIAAEKNEIARIRALAYDFKSRNPNLKIEAVPGGNLIGIDPTTGQMIPILDAQGQPIPSGKLSEEDKIILTGKQQQAVANINQAGANARNAATIAGATERDTNNWVTFQTPDGKTMRYNPSTNQVEEAPLPSGVSRIGVPGRTSTTTTSPSAQRTLRANRAQDVINRNPDVAQYISPNGTVAPAAKGGWFGAASPFDEAFRQQVVDYIEGKTDVVPVRQQGTVTPIRNTPGMPSLPQGSTVTASTSGTGPAQSVTMITPDGREVQIPSDKVSEAIVRGARRK